MLQDLRFGMRMLRRSPGFSALTILCLGVGMGAATSALSWIEGILLRPFPAVAHQDRLVAMTGVSREGRTDISWPDFQDFRKNCSLVQSFIAERIFGTTLSIGDRADRAAASVVSANYFQALGVRPILGRAFEPQDETGRNAHPVTVISYQAWKDRYAGDPAIIGRTQMMNGVKHTIIGVAPEGFYGTFVGYSFQFWVPASMEDTFIAGGYKLENRGAQWIEGFALLKPGVTLQQAQAEMTAVARRLEHDYPATNRGVGVKLYPLWETPFNGAGTLFPTLRMSMIVACFVLIIACANVGNLLMVRSFARRQEMTVRMSLGAGRARLLRLLLTEALILSAAAAAAGVAIAYSSRNLIMLAFPHTPGIVINLPAEMDWRVLAVCAAISLTATLLFGLVPAMQARKIDLAVAMRLESTSVVGGHRRAWVRSGLVLLQVSLSFVLLVAAGLLVESLLNMRDASPGFSTNVLTTSVDMIAAGYDRQRMKDFEDRLLERVEALGGVESAAWARSTPFSYRTPSSAPVTVEGYETAPGEQPTIEYNEVGPHYLSVLGIPLRSGREFTRADNETAPLVAVVNETMAQQFWKNADPIGRRFQLKGQSKPQWIQVVGIAKDAKYSSLIEKPKPFFYVPMRQSTPGQILQVRCRLGPDAMAHALAREVKALDSDLAPGEVITMREQIDRMTWAEGAAVTLLVIFGTIALSLAAIGLYGVISYAVSQSTRELGLRMALGANAADLLRLVFSHMFALTLAGVALGIFAALALTGLLGDLLYRVSPRDPVVFAAAFAVLLVSSLGACFAPALRAARIDPSRALRES